jgi:hypothetical protein
MPEETRNLHEWLLGAISYTVDMEVDAEKLPQLHMLWELVKANDPKLWGYLEEEVEIELIDLWYDSVAQRLNTVKNLRSETANGATPNANSGAVSHDVTDAPEPNGSTETTHSTSV